MSPVGEIARLWRYPVKSMLGERCETLSLESRGVAGDRRFAIRRADGKLGSGKNTRRFGRIDGLFDFQAGYRDEIPLIRFPGGEVLSGNDAPIHEALSAALGQPVMLAQEGEVSHLDAGPVHVLTSASLAWLRARLPDAQIDERRFRPNLVVEVPGSIPVEQVWIGKRLRVGEEVELRISAPTERCGMVAFSQSELPEEPAVLRRIAQEAGLQFGVYADVVVPGHVRLHEPVFLAD